MRASVLTLLSDPAADLAWTLVFFVIGIAAGARHQEVQNPGILTYSL